jgi:hypothetical protein
LVSITHETPVTKIQNNRLEQIINKQITIFITTYTFWSKKHIKKNEEEFQSTQHGSNNRGADKSLARPGTKQATATDFEFHISYL